MVTFRDCLGAVPGFRGTRGWLPWQSWSWRSDAKAVDSRVVHYCGVRPAHNLCTESCGHQQGVLQALVTLADWAHPFKHSRLGLA
jgi:hypothetical protein